VARRGAPSSQISKMTMRLSVAFFAALVLLYTAYLCPSHAVSLDFETTISNHDGLANLKEGKRLMALEEYDRAAFFFWRAVMLQSASPQAYTVEEAFQSFLQCFAIQGRTADGFVYIAQESFGRKQDNMGKMYLQQALAVDPNHEEALLLQQQLDMVEGTTSSTASPKQSEKKDEFQGKSPEELYAIASDFFSNRDYEQCADIFEISCVKSNHRLMPSCANAVYCRNMILDWGFNGTQFDQDMKRIQQISKLETAQYRTSHPNGTFSWQRSASVHPHMMLGYPVDPKLKRYVTESTASMDEIAARVQSDGSGIQPLPDDLPFHPTEDRVGFSFDSAEPDFKIKVGFVASGFNSKAVLYLSHDMFRFFDSDKFQIHIFSMGPPDNPLFIEHGMRGVDWRERVKSNVDYFHDVQKLKMDHVKLARFIHSQKIHILIEWDGYARQGERAQGLFALRPAPVQILHQEYLGTSGAQYVDYIFTDKITSPPHLEELYTEKFIYMPNHFFSKGHAVQAEVKPPTYDYTDKKDPYEPGSGSPKTNRCLAATAEEPSIVYCNFNKFLKNNPETLRSWIRILREVPGSMLCLLDNPDVGVPYLRKFVHEAAGTPSENPNVLFTPGDGDELNKRIHFLPWTKNPFDHQMRNHDFCNVMLDSYPYNGHTVAQDSLYGGVPIVTRSDGDDMSSRVSTSANIVLGLEELNAYEGPRQYEDIAIELGQNPAKLEAVRKILIETALQRNPMHAYWDVPRYVKNFETGLMVAWERYLAGKPPEHITIEETEDAKRGTYDELLMQHPPVGKKVHDEL